MTTRSVYMKQQREIQEAVEAVRREKDREIERLKAALGRLAMRSFSHDGSLCWCDGPVLDPMTHDHDPDCLQAREAMGYES